MSFTPSAFPLLAAVNLNGPTSYLSWSVFTISEPNLVVIIAMLVIFVAALLLPFPTEPVEGSTPEQPAARPGTAPPGAAPSTWTGRVRRFAVRALPPARLLPETQPSYVDSWIYVFGVASLAALAVVIISGFLIAIGGVDWWHTSAGGHFFNSIHLWSVEFFMALLVIHLWGKFFMAAWRGGRGRTWITGVLAFLASIGECFTGYLSQQNFDSQWIATNGKDAFNATGIGGLFNLMAFGQMLLWHVVLLPLVLLALVGLHVLFVRYRGVVHPFPARRGRGPLGEPTAGPAGDLSARQLRALDAAEWRGPLRRYDLVREAVAAVAVVLVATLALAAILSSPDLAPITIQRWAAADPGDFVSTAASELAGTSETATYGPPYNNASGSVQRLGVSWQQLAGVQQPINPAGAFVVDPLRATSGHDAALQAALRTWSAAPAGQQHAWANAYAAAAAKISFTSAGAPVLPAGNYGPVSEMMAAELALARSGGLDAGLLANQGFYGTNFTGPLLFLEDGSYYGNQAQAQHLQGNQWGVMNETGSYPGQPWLWLYQLWYHIPAFASSSSVDLIAIYLTGLATLLLLLIPVIPGLRAIPRAVPVYRLVWRRYYHEAESRPTPPARDAPGPSGRAGLERRAGSPRGGRAKRRRSSN
ncbi:MAG TPA: cytochrome b N-terminal domain-containing protein [Thermomicrobiaceae bacterium]|nr:cytochrome b N-terminal domain-containing protein [Thermomicrobiaceae bacterium]